MRLQCTMYVAGNSFPLLTEAASLFWKMLLLQFTFVKIIFYQNCFLVSKIGADYDSKPHKCAYYAIVLTRDPEISIPMDCNMNCTYCENSWIRFTLNFVTQLGLVHGITETFTFDLLYT